MNKETYDKLVKWFDEQPKTTHQDLQVNGDLLEIVRNDVREDGDIVSILHTYGCHCIGTPEHSGRVIYLYIVGDVWRNGQLVQQVFEIDYKLDELDEEYEENDEDRYSLVSSITNCSEAIY